VTDRRAAGASYGSVLTGFAPWIIERYAQVLSSGAIAVVALGSLGFTPFTEQYARLSTPREVWGLPGFRRINRLLTTVRGVTFAITAVLGYVALHVDTGQDWLNWIMPIMLSVGAIKFTARYPDHVTGGDAGASAVAA
jgi:hypothetical protein